jgi:hypothetical protein
VQEALHAFVNADDHRVNHPEAFLGCLLASEWGEAGKGKTECTLLARPPPDVKPSGFAANFCSALPPGANITVNLSFTSPHRGFVRHLVAVDGDVVYHLSTVGGGKKSKRVPGESKALVIDALSELIWSTPETVRREITCKRQRVAGAVAMSEPAGAVAMSEPAGAVAMSEPAGAVAMSEPE